MTRDGASVPELVELARELLGNEPSVYFAPSIPPDKEANARAVHDAHLPPGELVLVLHDATLFGSGEDGFLLTPERVCWKNLLEHPRQVPWSELDVGTVSVLPDRVGVAGGGIQANGELVAGAANLLIAMAERYVRTDHGPYRRRGDASPDVVSRLVVLARSHIGELDHIYYHPAIPRAKLRNARAVHAVNLGPDEPVAVLYDDTLFESARDGFLITPERLCWKNLVGEPESLGWADVAAEALVVSGNVLHLKGSTIHVTAGAEFVGKVAALLGAIAREASGSGRI